MASIRNTLNSEGGASLVIVMTVIVIAVIILAAIIPQAANQKQFTERSSDSTRALYAAESGLNRAINDINDDDYSEWSVSGGSYTLTMRYLYDSDGDTVGSYEIEMDMSDTEFPIAVSTGYGPEGLAGDTRSLDADIARVEAAIITKGDVDLGGDALVDPDEISEFATFTFERIFKDTKANVKADADTQVVVNPIDNYAPVHGWKEAFTDDNLNGKYDLGEPFTDDVIVNGICDPYRITWFEVSPGSKAKVASTNWDGDGILVVEGDIEITGGEFYGVIYVLGEMTFAAGNAEILGTIFIDGNPIETTNVKGTTSIKYDPNAIDDPFGYNPLPFARSTWEEFYD
jgi:hypothetical protein